MLSIEKNPLQSIIIVFRYMDCYYNISINSRAIDYIPAEYLYTKYSRTNQLKHSFSILLQEFGTVFLKVSEYSLNINLKFFTSAPFIACVKAASSGKRRLYVDTLTLGNKLSEMNV